jgi:hypothetical protein
VKTEAELLSAFQLFSSQDNAAFSKNKSFVKEKTGATEKIIKYIEKNAERIQQIF